MSLGEMSTAPKSRPNPASLISVFHLVISASVSRGKQMASSLSFGTPIWLLWHYAKKNSIIHFSQLEGYGKAFLVAAVTCSQSS